MIPEQKEACEGPRNLGALLAPEGKNNQKEFKKIDKHGENNDRKMKLPRPYNCN
jgi:hypothetical protein